MPAAPIEELRKKVQDKTKQLRGALGLSGQLGKNLGVGTLIGRIPSVGGQLGGGQLFGNIGKGRLIAMVQGKRPLRSMFVTEKTNEVPASPQMRGHIVDRPRPSGPAVETEVYPADTQMSVEL